MCKPSLKCDEGCEYRSKRLVIGAAIGGGAGFKPFCTKLRRWLKPEEVGCKHHTKKEA
jgi:hypothetical protein